MLNEYGILVCFSFSFSKVNIFVHINIYIIPAVIQGWVKAHPGPASAHCLWNQVDMVKTKGVEDLLYLWKPHADRKPESMLRGGLTCWRKTKRIRGAQWSPWSATRAKMPCCQERKQPILNKSMYQGPLHVDVHLLPRRQAPIGRRHTVGPPSHMCLTSLQKCNRAWWQMLLHPTASKSEFCNPLTFGQINLSCAFCALPGWNMT
jgi:hypothetical protein